MKKRLRKRKKIRGGRAVFRSIMDPAEGVTYWQGPDGVFRPLMRTQNVYLRATREFDDDDPRGEQMRDMLAAFKREMLRTLRERLPGEIWAKIEEEPTP